jgi:hypothetical protein
MHIGMDALIPQCGSRVLRLQREPIALINSFYWSAGILPAMAGL